MVSRSGFLNFSLLLILSLVCGLVYQNTLLNEFTFDDMPVVNDNYYIKHSVYLSDVFNLNYFEYFRENSYRPVVTLSYFMDYALWGLSSKGFHFTNVVLHGINALLVFCLVFRLCGNSSVSFVATMIFAVHPVATESVNAVGFREELLVVLCVCGGLLLFLNVLESCRRHSWAWCAVFFILSLFLFFVGLFSKETTVVFPVLLWFVCLYVSRGEPISLKEEDRPAVAARRLTAVYGVLVFCVIAFYGVVRFYIFQNPLEHRPVFTPDIGQRILSGISIAGYYGKLFLFPFPLTAAYSFPKIVGFELLRPALTLCLMIFLSRGIWATGNRLLLFGWAWFWVSWLPTSNFYPLNTPVAERFLYLPSIGVFILFAALFEMYCRLAYVRNVVIGIILCWAALTIDRNKDWETYDKLWTQAYKVSPRSPDALNNLGVYYFKKENYGEAIGFFETAIKLKPENPMPYSNLGLSYYFKNDPGMAVAVLERGLALNPMEYTLLVNLGRVKLDKGPIEEGMNLLRLALAMRPHIPEPFLLMGNYYVSIDQYDQARHMYEAAREKNPNSLNAWIGVGVTYASQMMYDKAVEMFLRAVQIDPSSPVANRDLAGAYYYLKDYENAAKYAKIAKEAGGVLPDLLLSLVGP